MSVLHVLFKVADAEYVIPADQVLFMETFAGATRVPGAPAHVEGIVQARGQVVPVVNLRQRFGLPPAERTLDARIVVVRSGERTVGLLVDSAREVVRLPEDGFKPPPDALAQQGNGFVKAIAQKGATLVMLVDVGGIVGQESQHGG